MNVLELLLENTLLLVVVAIWVKFGFELGLCRLRYELKRRYGK